MSKSNILLESGTNELEIVEFGIGQNTFGINVAKVREIIQPNKLAMIPNSHPCIEGIFQLRERIIPLVNLAEYLNLPSSELPNDDKFVVTEFNQLFTAFHVHSVSRIHRVSWKDIEAPSTLTTSYKSVVTGVIKMEGRIILLLDFEKIVYDIAPSTGMKLSQTEPDLINKVPLRAAKKLMLVEDSDMLRNVLIDILDTAGYHSHLIFRNGEEAWDYLNSAITSPSSDQPLPALIITDIEMPKMDGHHLTKRIRDTSGISDIPIVIFSSLINPQMLEKGYSIGATAQVSKPDIDQLINIIDRQFSL